MIIILEKSKNKNAQTLLLVLKDKEVSEQEIINALASDVESQGIFEISTVETSQLYDTKTDKVYVVGDAVSSVLLKVAKNSWKLDGEEIQQGVVTPQHFLASKAVSNLASSNHKTGEGIFVLTKLETERLKLNQRERRLLRPFHYAEEIDSYYYNSEVGHYLIYTPVEIAKDIESNPNKYPNIKAHLDKYQSVITSDHKPYGIHRARQPEWFEDAKKIIGVRKAVHPKFVVVPEVWYGDQAVLIIKLAKHKKISPHFVVAILNSKLAHFWLYQQKRQGNQLQIDKEVLLNFPFPHIDVSSAVAKKLYDNVINLVGKIVSQKQELGAVKKSEADIFGEKEREIERAIKITEHRLDQLIYRLYGLGKEDIRQIEDVVIKAVSV